MLSHVVPQERLLDGRYRFRSIVGQGGYGVVAAYEDTAENNSLVAIKSIESIVVHNEGTRIFREIHLLKYINARHPCVISYLRIFLEPPTPSPEEEFKLHIVMPLLDGDLKTHFIRKLIVSRPVFPLLDKQELAMAAVMLTFQMCFGLDYLHKCGIVHRDLKPGNIFVRNDFSNPGNSVAMIGDFGLGRGINAEGTQYVCTRFYRPPEIVTRMPTANAAIDIWSMGCVLFELVTGNVLFRLDTARTVEGKWNGVKASQQLEAFLDVIGTPSVEEIMTYLPTEGNVRSYLVATSERTPRRSFLEEKIRREWKLIGTTPEEQELWIDLISSCLKLFPAQRPTAEDLCRHALFKSRAILFGENVRQFPAENYKMPDLPLVPQLLHEELIRMVLHDVNDDGGGEEAKSFSPTIGESSWLGTPGSLHRPKLSDPVYEAKYQSFSVSTAEGVASAIRSVMDDIGLLVAHGSDESDPPSSSRHRLIGELQSLLNYYQHLRPSRHNEMLLVDENDGEDEDECIVFQPQQELFRE